MDIVIIGGGIIGCITAYYLSRHPSFSSCSSTTITLLEASKYGAAQGASGKAGGLVARWAYPKELVDVSFDEHVKLAREHNGAERWGWRYVNCSNWEGRGELAPDGIASRSVGEKGRSRKSLERTIGVGGGSRGAGTTGKKRRLPDDLLWVEEDLTDSYSPMAGDRETAQVHPYLFTTSMLEFAKARGVTFVKGKVSSIVQVEGKVTGVSYVDIATQETASLPATHVILAAGPWSPSLLPTLPITATRAHSITIRPKPMTTVAPYVLFTEISLPKEQGRFKTATPEIYARPDNEVYSCGPGDDPALPDTVDDVVVDVTACDSIYTQVSSISQDLRAGTVGRRQACFLPSVNAGGGPIVGEAVGIARGLIVATGHTCWVIACSFTFPCVYSLNLQGICNAPGTARAISELVMDGQIKCTDLRRLQPALFLQK
jgi:glycine/D-amino acid oxidase-like deaminating enzyme